MEALACGATELDPSGHQLSTAATRCAGIGSPGNPTRAAYLSVPTDPTGGLLEPTRASARHVPSRRTRLASGRGRRSREADHPVRWPPQSLQLSRIFCAG